MKVKIFFLIAILSACTFCISSKSQKNEPVERQNGQYMFFIHSSYANSDRDTLSNPNAALLIEDKNEIENAKKYFLSECHAYHLCGYHYDALFFSDTDSLADRVCLNKECELFAYKPIKSQKQLNFYAKKLIENPSHYIYDMEIPVSFMPEDVKKELRDNKWIVFSFESDLQRFPSLTFTYEHSKYVGKNASKKAWEIAGQEKEAEATKLVMEIVDTIKAVSKVINNPEIFYNYFGGTDEETTIQGDIEIIFTHAKDLQIAADILQQTQQATIKRVNIPETYTLQIIDTTNDIENIKHQLQPYKFIKNVSKYLEKKE